MDVMSLEEMAESDDGENHNARTMTIVRILVDAEDYEASDDCG